MPDLPAGPSRLVARLARCHAQAQQLHERLLPQQARVRQWRRCLAAGPHLLAALPPLDPDAPEPAHAPNALRRRWLARLLEAATDHLAPTNPITGAPAHALLAARRAAWLHEAATLAAYLAAHPTGQWPAEA